METLLTNLNMRRCRGSAVHPRTPQAFACSLATLAKYACIGGGPAFRKAGKFPIYSRDDLDAWAKLQSRQACSFY